MDRGGVSSVLGDGVLYVARRIAELREAAGLTQAEVAERMRMAVTNYQRIEGGKQNVTIEMLVRIANALGNTTAAFFTPTASTKRRPRGRPRKQSR